jgi:hypothetical protein
MIAHEVADAIPLSGAWKSRKFCHHIAKVFGR